MQTCAGSYDRLWSSGRAGRRRRVGRHETLDASAAIISSVRPAAAVSGADVAKPNGVNQSANGNSHLLLAKQTADKYITSNGGEPSKAHGGYSHKRPGEATAAENAEKVRRALIVLRTLTPFMPIASLRSDAENALADIREFFR